MKRKTKSMLELNALASDILTSISNHTHVDINNDLQLTSYIFLHDVSSSLTINEVLFLRDLVRIKSRETLVLK